MDTWLSFWGFQIRADIALWLFAIYLVIGLVLIIAIPWYAVPVARDYDDKGNEISLSLEARAKIIEMRSKVRATVIQVVAGIAVIGTFVTTIQQIRGTEDAFNQKKAELFAKSVKELLSGKSTDSTPEATRAEAIHVLSFVARSDRSYHRAVFDALSTYVKTTSTDLCGGKQSEAGFKLDATVQLAMRSIGERRPQDDPTGKRFNLEHGCYVGLDLQDEWNVVKGFARTRISTSQMHRANFVKAELQGTELMGIRAGDYENPDWCIDIGNRLHDAVQEDPRPAVCRGGSDGDERRRFVAHFIDANLTAADFSSAQLQGADFSGATVTDASFKNASISRVSFKGVTGLTAKQLESACVGHPGMSADELKCEQPYFSKEMIVELKGHEKLANGIRQCGSGADGKIAKGASYQPKICPPPPAAKP